ncbi:putative ribonuclease H-like domain-containing protein [Tanacetum coccineum]
MQEELLQFKLQKVWTLADLPKGKRAIGTKWMDVKSAFLYGIIEEEAYVCQPPSFEDPQFPDKVYKVEKALYGLHQAPRAWYETLSTYLLENGFRRGIIDKTLFIKKEKGDILLVQTTSTPIETNNALIKDEEAEDVDGHLYRSMIGSLMYSTASRPDIMFVVCACARDSPFDLEAFFDSDYAGVSLDRKSTIGGCQFIGKRLISWQCKQQTIVANSTTEAEYVAAANCYGQEDRMERTATTDSSLEVEQDNGNINKTQSMATLNEPFPQGIGSGSGPRFALSENPTIYDSLIKQFWQTATVNTLDNGEQEITAITPVADESAFISVDVVHGGAATTVSSIDAGQGNGNIPKSPNMPHDSPLPRGHTPGNDEGSMTLNELTVLCTKLSNKVDSLETELKKTKQTYGETHQTGEEVRANCQDKPS